MSNRRLRARIGQGERIRVYRDYLDNVAASNTEGMSIAQFLFLCVAVCGIGAFILAGINCRNAELDAQLKRIEQEARR